MVRAATIAVLPPPEAPPARPVGAKGRGALKLMRTMHACYAGEVQCFHTSMPSPFSEVGFDEACQSSKPTIVELTNVGCKFDYYGGAKGKGPAMRFGPIEKLGDAIDLVVMARHRESQHLLQERAKPGRLLGQVDLTRLKAGALSFHPHKFVALGLDANGYRNTGHRVRPKVLDEMQAWPSLLDQNAIGLMFECKGNELLP